MYFYDKATGALASAASFGYIDFDATASGVQGFDPSVHSLQDVADAINNTFGTYCTAQIINGTLSMTAESGYTFAYGEDSAGLYPPSAEYLFHRVHLPGRGREHRGLDDTDHLNSGHVNGAGEINSGDNTTAKALAALSSTDVSITTYTAARPARPCPNTTTPWSAWSARTPPTPNTTTSIRPPWRGSWPPSRTRSRP
jgi:flagellar hook-associated protein 1 FlgK